jgi:WhiB family transcriptional regulator, redox-sensing transcriptional regulator
MIAAWRARAVCGGMNPDIFFPPNGAGPHPDAVAACARCPVRADCLTWSVGPPFQGGFLGGMTENERRSERQRRIDARRRPRKTEGADHAASRAGAPA